MWIFPENYDPIIEEPDSAEVEYDARSTDTSNESDWSIEEDDFYSPHQRTTLVIEEVIESTTPIEETGKKFIILFYSLLSRVQREATWDVEPVQTKVQRIFSLFHPQAILSLQGTVFCGAAIGNTLANTRGFCFEPKIISTQPTFPLTSLLIMVHGIARSKRMRKRALVTPFNEENNEKNFVWKRFSFTQVFFLLATGDEALAKAFIITNTLIRTTSGTNR